MVELEFLVGKFEALGDTFLESKLYVGGIRVWMRLYLESTYWSFEAIGNALLKSNSRSKLEFLETVS